MTDSPPVQYALSSRARNRTTLGDFFGGRLAAARDTGAPGFANANGSELGGHCLSTMPRWTELPRTQNGPSSTTAAFVMPPNGPL